MNAISPAFGSSTSLSSPDTGPDAPLLRLSVMLEQFIARENEAWTQVSVDHEDDNPLKAKAEERGNDTEVVVTEVLQHRAMMLNGLLVKVRALQGAISDFGPRGPNSFIFCVDPCMTET